ARDLHPAQTAQVAGWAAGSGSFGELPILPLASFGAGAWVRSAPEISREIVQTPIGFVWRRRYEHSNRVLNCLDYHWVRFAPPSRRSSSPNSSRSTPPHPGFVWSMARRVRFAIPVEEPGPLLVCRLRPG